MNKTILVTGSAKGIGREIILEFAKSGYNCVINYLTSKDEAEELKEEVLKLGSKCLAIKADVRNEIEVDQMFLEVEKAFGGVSVLVNNAAIDLSNVFEKKTIEDFKETIDVNLIGAYITSKRAFPYMKENKWGRIINISSTNGINTYYPMCLEYDASKAALNSLTHNLAILFAPYVNVNAIAPGFIGTKSELEDYDKEFLELELDKILVRRFGEPKEVAHLVKFLASDEASFINNTIIRIDGGQYGS